MHLKQTILISDMDDTLFDSEKHISNKNIQAIREFQEMGGMFTIATGRSITGFRPYQKMMGIKIPVILYNGSCIYDYQTDHIMWVQKLPKKVQEYIRELTLKFPELGMQIMTESGIYSYRPTPVFWEYMQRENLPYKVVEEFGEIPEGWIKAEMTCDLVNRKTLDDYLETTVPESVRCLNTGIYSREIVAAGVSKGSAVSQYRKLMNLSGKTVCCIGDHNNDFEMIQMADVGFAVNNALEIIKKAADIIVTDNDHDAVAEAIRKIESI